jgi:hypothetical protein
MKRIWYAFIALVVVSAGAAFTAANVVPASKGHQSTNTIDANALKPTECASLSLTAVVAGDTGTSANELILGTGAANSPNGAGGDDCIVAGDGNDTIDGGAGTDVCLGGSGTDTYFNCETVSDPDGTCTVPGTQTLIADTDSWVKEDAATTNFGNDTTLSVRPDNTKRRRAFVHFALPAIPAGCVLTAATLRLNASAANTAHTIEVYRAAASWVENTITWNIQPATAGTAVSAVAAVGWNQWTVTTHVQNFYSGTNTGFRVQDAADAAGSPNGFQTYSSSEAASNKPELVITFG